MTDLPRLIIGCKRKLMMDTEGKRVLCGEDEILCSVCSHNKSVIDAHAAAHQKEMDERYAGRKGNKDMMVYWHEARGARDAVLALAENLKLKEGTAEND